MISIKVCLFVSFCLVLLGQKSGLSNGLNYVEVFRDDFNGGVDRGKWNVITAPSTVNNELHHYVSDEVWNENGMMFLRGRRRDYGGRQYTAGRVDTQGKFEFLYGEVEWRAKLELRGRGFWPALWLLQFQCPPARPCPGTWPPEIDVIEFRGDIPNQVTHAVHYGRYPNNNHDTVATVGPDFANHFHTYKVIWDPNQIVWFVDGVQRFRITEHHKIPHEKMYLIMNVAIGGWYPGNPDGSTQFPGHMIIDYVKVHRWQ